MSMSCDEFSAGIAEGGALERALDHRLTPAEEAGPVIDRHRAHMEECEPCRNRGLIFGAKQSAVNPNIL